MKALAIYEDEAPFNTPGESYSTPSVWAERTLATKKSDLNNLLTPDGAGFAINQTGVYTVSGFSAFSQAAG